MNLFQLTDIAFNIFYGREIKKQKQATVFIEMSWGNQRKSQGSEWKGNKEKESKALETN